MGAENGRCTGLGCERSGTCTVEVHILHSGVGGEGSCGVRKDLGLCMVRRRGSALDRSATTIADEQVEGFAREICTHIWGVVRHRDKLKLGRVASKEQGGC